MYGQASPQPIVTTTSAHSESAWSRRWGRRPARSTPTSRIAVTTSGWTWAAGSDPAERAGPPSLSQKAWAIWDRPALWTQTKSARGSVAVMPLSLRPRPPLPELEDAGGWMVPRLELDKGVRGQGVELFPCPLAAVPAPAMLTRLCETRRATAHAFQ